MKAGCSDHRGAIIGCLVRDRMGFLVVGLKAVAMVEELSPVFTFETRWAFSSLLLWSYRPFRACLALEGIESGDVWEDGVVDCSAEHVVYLSADYLPVIDSDL